MYRFVLILFVLLGGCTPYTDAQLALITQARRGLELVDQAQYERAQLIERYHQLLRQTLDDAFDDDVRERGALDPAWVIEHRRAYAAALDALAAQRIASRDAHAATAANLHAIAQSLDRLESLTSLPSRLLADLEVRP